MERERVAWARVLGQRYMSPLGRRWQHVQAVAARAEALPFTGDDATRLVAAAYLHDIGYADELAGTGFHPLDGARHLRALGEEGLATLVAHHSNARYEAQLRGFDDYEQEFPFEGTRLDLALTYCDMTTSPDGRPVSLDERVTELVERYGADHVTARAIVAGLPQFRHGEQEIRRLCDMAASIITEWRGPRESDDR